LSTNIELEISYESIFSEQCSSNKNVHKIPNECLNNSTNEDTPNQRTQGTQELH
ncbi:34735_t:CDS:1, partial [Racocetra persica]